MSLSEARRALGGAESTFEVMALADGFETVATFRRAAKTVSAVFPGRITPRSRTGLVGVRTCVSTRGLAAESFASQLKTRFGDPSDGAAILDAGLRSGQATWGTATCPIEVRAFRASQWWDPSADELCVEIRAVRPPVEAPSISIETASRRPEPPRPPVTAEPAVPVLDLTIAGVPEPKPQASAAPIRPQLHVPSPVPVQVPLRAADPASDVAVPGTATAPRLVSSNPPQYPPLLRQQRIHARVVVRATILTDGTVGDVVVAENDHPGLGLEDRVVAAVRKWRYAPATQSGTPVTAEILIPFEFR